MKTSNNSQELVQTASKFKTVEAAKAWWNSLTAGQKAAFVGGLTLTAMGGYVVYATWGSVSLSTAIWGGILYGAGPAACATVISYYAFEDDAKVSAMASDVADEF